MACVLIIGNGGREHVLATLLVNSPHVQQILCAPGNAGTATICENINLSVDDFDGLVALAKKRNVDLTVVGPEAPLCAGIVDRFKAEGLRIFGPNAAAARIEGDKAYAKRLMKLAHVPTAEARIFEHYDSARDYVATRDTGVVVKASGLAAGKGVFVCPDPAEALIELEKMMVDKTFGKAGEKVIVEELIKGQELSVLALVDHQTIYILETAQDHKALNEGDTGPNTGGMGAYSPASIATSEVMSIVEKDVLVPIVDAMRNDGASYSGLLYAGLMLTAAGPKVLEFNCRFGDPEAQAVLMRLDSDLYEMLTATIDGQLEGVDIRWKAKPAVCVVMASGGYPGIYQAGKVIEGLDEADALDEVKVFHAGTKMVENKTVSAGGRVLGVTALGEDIADAITKAYTAVDKIHFEESYCRRDIADKAIGANT